MEKEVKGSSRNDGEEEVEQEQGGVDLIPPEVGWRIFSYLRAADLCRVGGVCRSWRAISSDPLLWQGFYREGCCEVWPPDAIDTIDIRAEVIEAIKLKWEWDREMVERLNKARERYSTTSGIRLSNTVRATFRQSRKAVKLVAVGDSGVGKTKMLYAWSWPASQNNFSDYMPTCISFQSRDVAIDHGNKASVAPWDTVGSEDYDALRPLSYPGTDVFLLCYSVVDPQSLENLRSRWLPEIRRHCPDVPFILVGCKRDLAPQDGDDVKKDEKQEGHGEEIAGGEQEPRARGDGGGVITQPQQQQHVSYEQAQLMAFELGAMAFIECSTKTAFNLDETIALAANYAVYQPLDLIADQGQRRCLLQ